MKFVRSINKDFAPWSPSRERGFNPRLQTISRGIFRYSWKNLELAGSEAVNYNPKTIFSLNVPFPLTSVVYYFSVIYFHQVIYSLIVIHKSQFLTCLSSIEFKTFLREQTWFFEKFSYGPRIHPFTLDLILVVPVWWGLSGNWDPKGKLYENLKYEVNKNKICFA